VKARLSRDGWLNPSKERIARSQERRPSSQSFLAALECSKQPSFEIAGWRPQINNTKSAHHETIKSMRSKITIYVGNITMLLAIATAFPSACFARIIDTWVLSSSSFTTNATSGQVGTDDFGGHDGSTMVWSNGASGTTSYSVSDSSLGVSQYMSGYAYIHLNGWPDDGPFGKDLVASFVSTANANWSDSDGATQTQITTVGDLSGTLVTAQYCQFTSGYSLTTADAAGTSGLSVTGQFSDTNFASITNTYSSSGGGINSAFDSGDASFSDESITTSNFTADGSLWINQTASVDYSLTWTNTYTTTSGLTSLSASSAITGMAVANLISADTEYVQDIVAASISLSGSVTTTINTFLDE
jgi:hypothetical protein